MHADTTAAKPAPASARAVPWWRFGIVWFALSGPALVVVAGFATMAIAFHHADAEVHEPAPAATLSVPMGAATGTPVVGTRPLTAAPASRSSSH